MGAMPGTDPILVDAMSAEKRKVARHSIYAAVAITIGKLVVGVVSGSLGILSEALNSALDLVMTVLTFVSVRVSDKPPDADHMYGHGKAENLTAFMQMGLLLGISLWIIAEAVRRLFFTTVHVDPSPAAYAVLVGSIVIDYWRSRALLRVARKYDSQALEADALHFRTDMWQVAVVIVGLLLVQAGQRFQVPWLAAADPIAALLVAGLIIFVSTRLARQTVDALLDAAPPGIRTEIAGKVGNITGVLDVERVRIRRGGNRYFADVTVGLSRKSTFQKTEKIVSDVTGAVQRVLPDADVLVHTMARPAPRENIFDRIKGVALRNDLIVHDVSVQDLGGRLHVEQHLELDERLPLLEAHEQVTALEAEIRKEVPEIASILTHIESEPATIEPGAEIGQDPSLEYRLKKIVAEFPEVLDLHEIVVKRVRERVYVSCHVTLPDDLPLERVHDIQTAIEIRFKQDAPELFKVLIHPEPQTDNRR
jgi:cation diffusion facilitator family transporter